MASPDHAATVRDALGRLMVPDYEAMAALDALVAALAQAEHERDEARKHANKLGRELDEQGDELERAERQRDRAIEALREILMAEPDDPASPDGKTAWPSFAGRLQAIAGDVLANIEKDTAS